VVTPPPDRDAELADDLSIGFLLLLERLTPEERAALLLREVFDAEYAEIARTLEKTEAACRQLVHRAKQHVRRRRRFQVAPDVRERLARRFVEALHAEDREGVLALLTDDALLAADGGGRVPAVAGTQRGAERVAQLLVGFERASRAEVARRRLLQPEHEVVWLNGEPAVLTMAAGKLLFATILHLEGDRIAAIYRVLNPGKLAGLGFKTFLDPDQMVGGVS
jgi:RNA polymerase sigma-70 factor (ECF subfamily)